MLEPPQSASMLCSVKTDYYARETNLLSWPLTTVSDAPSLLDWTPGGIADTLQIARWLPAADQLIILSEDGTVAQCGTFDELSAVDGYLKGLQVSETANGVEDDNSISPLAGKEDVNDIKMEAKAPAQQTSAKTTYNRGAAAKGNLVFYLGSMGIIPITLFCVLVVVQVACRTVQRTLFPLQEAAPPRCLLSTNLAG